MVVLVAIGVLTGLTTVLFGFGGGFVTVPVIVWVNAALGADAMHTAVATSAIVMVVNAGIATAATRRDVLGALRGSAALVALLGCGAVLGALAARWVPSPVTQWAFVGYLVLTIGDLLARPGFLGRQPSDGPAAPDVASGIPRVLGLPIGALAAFLGVGGSVMTVPLLRRSGHPMRTATALANPLTLVIAAPATAVFLLDHAAPGAGSPGTVLLLGAVDVGAGAALLAGALPVIVALRRRPPRIPDRVHAWSYLLLLVAVTAAMAVSAL
ncbi:hypothetical protein DEF23_06750 [Marinitenerispora sediminis]|uniref:Probable membrane transporter protein n=1 Tax=Marinitenerispora sediminis TaxID=1931232 RepID=A0A368T814_9ACTN|nr:hypothetical protein DEF28_01310 [Marinitenerispora sediminis]RCV58318.1 hypothetical protein DEF24_13855 [Marinitenerispora sediminis]RCV59687.1 hypothetical protein DEF23_06750 [Marinitenerispora sediminis]